MLALKKKAEKKAAEEAAAAAAADKNGEAATSGDMTETPSEQNVKKISLFGVDGKKKKENGSNGKQKKRTAGEIRIQKGNVYVVDDDV